MEAMLAWARSTLPFVLPKSAGLKTVSGLFYGELSSDKIPKWEDLKRADEAGGIYHALRRGNTRSTIFHKPEDYEALEQFLAEGLTRYACRIPAYQLMPNNSHFVLQPTEDGGMSNFLRWISLTHTRGTTTVV
jgi:hypothetical protein